MIKHLALTLLCGLFTIQAVQADKQTSAQSPASFDSAATLVEIEITKTSYDYSLPWNTRNRQSWKNGIVIAEHQILTTADGFSGQTLCRVRKGGIAHQYTATLKWIDYYTNIAILDIEDPVFWEGMQPTRLSESIPESGELQILRWRNGRIEERAAEIIQLYVGKNKMSYVNHLHLSASTNMDAAGWSEVILFQNEIIGLAAASTNDNLTILPAPVIAAVLKQKASGKDSGIGHFDFSVMDAKNPSLLQSKGMQASDIGVVVTKVGARRLAANTLKVGDVLLAIDGFEIDNDGKYIDPTYGRLSLYGLATRNYEAGDTLPMRVWRDNQELSVDYTLPRAEFEKALVPEQLYDQAPEYLIAGGLLFQPITGPYLNTYGKNKPLLLDYYSYNAELPERDGLVILSSVIPDNYNLGYESTRQLIVDSINGYTIHTITDITKALENPKDEFHRIEFMPGQWLKHMVLEAATMDAATQRILEHYNIPKASSD
ncbi:MAG: PDZ domain-containing protein [Opitutaceae bacterium]